MNQLAKTGIFAGVAVVAVVLAVVASMPRRFGNVSDDPAELLFRDFQDPTVAQSMAIIKFEEDTGTRHEFKVARVKDEKGRELWRIDSHNNYPADANTQLAGAASALVNKQRGARLSSNRGQHGTYGVLDPTAEGSERGRGTLVVFEGENEKKLAELIVGKPVKDKPSQRYVRIRGQDAVYQAEIDAGKFSTKFEDWIERDLLKMDAWRIKEIVIEDLDVVQGRLVSKGLLQFKYDGSAGETRWELAGLAADEKLEEAKLNDMRNGLDELKIVDVRQKLPALAALLSGKDDNNQHDPIEMQMVRAQLKAHGFVITSNGIVPTDGVVNVQMEDGLSYTLFFGGIAELTADQTEAGRKKAANPEEGDKKEGDDAKADDAKTDDARTDDAKAAGEKKDKAIGSNRYVFVMVNLNERFVKKPEIKPLPGNPLLPVANAEKAEEGKKEAGAAETKAKPAAKPQRVALADSVKELRRLHDEGLMDQTEFEHQRKQTEDANRRAQEQYDKDIEAARKREKELNERFADWYYVIDDEAYRKIRLKRPEIVKGPEKAKDEAGKEKGKGDAESGAPAKATKAGATKTP